MTTNQTSTPFEATLNKLNNQDFNRVTQIFIDQSTKQIERIQGGGQRQTR